MVRERQTRLSRLRQKIWAPDNARSTTRIPPSLERTRFDKISHQRQHIWQHTPNAQLHLRDHGIEDLIAITATGAASIGQGMGRLHPARRGRAGFTGTGAAVC